MVRPNPQNVVQVFGPVVVVTTSWLRGLMKMKTKMMLRMAISLSREVKHICCKPSVLAFVFRFRFLLVCCVGAKTSLASRPSCIRFPFTVLRLPGLDVLLTGSSWSGRPMMKCRVVLLKFSKIFN